MNEFEPARLRIERARVHAAEMAEVWNNYLRPHPFDFALVRNTSTTYVLRVTQSEPVPAELSVLFGEWLYNLRSALDYIIWATAVHTSGQVPPPGEGGLQYPIYDEAAAWKKNEWRLRPLGEHHRKMLSIMQPFNSDIDANYLGWINRLARIDRHRTLSIWTARIGEANPVLRIPSGERPRLEWGQRVFVGGVCDLARVTFGSPDAADGVEANPRSGIDPEIADWAGSSFWGRYRFSERLNLMHVFVHAELAFYEYDCTGVCDNPDLIADSFRRESDTRRAEGFFPKITRRPEPTAPWVLGAAPRRSTNEKFRGLDYPPDGPGKVSR